MTAAAAAARVFARWCFRDGRGLTVAAALLTTACGAPLMKLPGGPGAPASDSADAFTEATAACRGISAISADIAASGKVNGQRLRGHLLVGLAAPALARLEAVAPVGQPLFIFVARDDDATLLLPRDDRILEHGRPAAVLEAVTGVPVDARELRHALTGCAIAAATPVGRSLGADWRLVALGATDVYLHRDPPVGRWQLVAAVHRGGSGTGDPSAARGHLAVQSGANQTPAMPRSAAAAAGGEWRAEYREFSGGLPRAVHLVSADPSRFDLSLTLSQVALNEALGPEVFRIDVPRSAQPITLDELQHARPGVREN